MREKIGKLAKGIFDKNTSDILLSEVFIEGSIKEKGVWSGSFTIDSTGEDAIYGRVDGNSCHIILKEKEFYGTHAVIHYEIQALGLPAGEHLRGEIQIISDAGERSIPYDITVESPFIETSMGRIHNMFHFTNLVKYNYEEALEIFLSPQFEEVFLASAPTAQGIYDSLKKSSSIKTAMEEFLIYAKKKMRIQLCCSEEKKWYDDLEETHEDIIVLQKDNWGYLEIDVQLEGDFLSSQKLQITTEEFIGNVYEFRYRMDEPKLHAGLNCGCVIFTTPYQKIICEIDVMRKPNDPEHKKSLWIRQKGMAELSEQYFEFRLHKITTDTWCKRTIEVMNGIKDLAEKEDMLYMKLLEAQVHVALKRQEHASRLLHEVSESFLEEEGEKDIPLICYYLYIRSLYARASGVTRESAKQVKEYYNSGYDDWRIAWVLLYLDEEHILNKSLRLSRLKEQYAKGCRSPFLYYEACAAFNEQPPLLRVLNSFELQVMWWGFRHHFVREKAAIQIAELAMVERKGTRLLLRLLEGIYEEYHQEKVLEAILTILIRKGEVHNKYFKWYEEGVRQDIRLTGLYEGYMNALPPGALEPLPRVVSHYFLYDNSLSEDKKGVLFASILQHEKPDSPMIHSYMPAIERYTIEQLMKERMSLELSLLYKRVISESILNDEMAFHYPALLLMRRLSCSAKQIRFVILRHKELEEEQKIPLMDGTAYFPIYTEDHALVFEDDRGRRFYEHISYELKDIMREETMVRYCYSLHQGDIYLWLHICEREGIYGGNLEEGIQTFRKVAEYPRLKCYYRNQIEQKIIDYYLDHYDADSLESYLRDLHKEQLDRRECNNVIELMLIRGMYEEAKELLEKHGYDQISSNRLMKYCIHEIQETNQRLPFLLDLCAFVFQRGKYEENILSYLLTYYNGSTKEMLKIWQSAKDFEVEANMMEERLLVQAMFTDICLSGVSEVFDDYYRYGTDQDVVDAYLAQQSYLYFVCQMVVSHSIFKYLEQRYEEQELLLVEQVALLKYYAEKEECSESQLDLAEHLMDGLVEEGYIFAFYMKFAGRIKLPIYLRDKQMLEYRTKAGRKVELHYLLDVPSMNYKYYTTEILQPLFGDIYNKQFILFYGEKLQYYIAEEEAGVSSLTESDTIEAEDWQGIDGESRFGLLSSMGAAFEWKDVSAIKALADSYLEKMTLVEAYGELR